MLCTSSMGWPQRGQTTPCGCASGMRLTECLQRRVKDLDFTYLQITIRDGKS